MVVVRHPPWPGINGLRRLWGAPHIVEGSLGGGDPGPTGPAGPPGPPGSDGAPGTVNYIVFDAFSGGSASSVYDLVLSGGGA